MNKITNIWIIVFESMKILSKLRIQKKVFLKIKNAFLVFFLKIIL